MEAKPYQIKDSEPLVAKEPVAMYQTEAYAGIRHSLRRQQAPAGYMTGTEFWCKVEQDVEQICEKYGVL